MGREGKRVAGQCPARVGGGGMGNRQVGGKRGRGGRRVALLGVRGEGGRGEAWEREREGWGRQCS